MGRTNSWKNDKNREFCRTYPSDGLMFREVFLLSMEILLLVFVFMASIKFAILLVKRLQKEPPDSHLMNLFWATSAVFFSCNIINMLYDLGWFLILSGLERFDSRNSAICNKVIILCMVLLFGFVWMIVGSRAPNRKCRFSLALFNIGLFLFLSAANVLPVLLSFFVQPLIVLSIVAYKASMLFTYTVYFAAGLHLKSSRLHYFVVLKEVYYYILISILGALFLGMSFILMHVLFSGAQVNASSLSFIPPAIIGGIGYLIKRKVLDKRKGTRNKEDAGYAEPLAVLVDSKDPAKQRSFEDGAEGREGDEPDSSTNLLGIQQQKQTSL